MSLSPTHQMHTAPATHRFPAGLANSHHFFAHLGKAKPIVSAVLAVVLWPVVLLGVNLHIK